MSRITITMESHHLLMLYGAVNREAAAGLDEMEDDASPEQIGAVTQHLKRLGHLRDELKGVYEGHQLAPGRTHVLTDMPR